MVPSKELKGAAERVYRVTHEDIRLADVYQNFGDFQEDLRKLGIWAAGQIYMEPSEAIKQFEKHCSGCPDCSRCGRVEYMCPEGRRLHAAQFVGDEV